MGSGQDRRAGDQGSTASLAPEDAPPSVLHVGHVGVLLNGGRLASNDALGVPGHRCRFKHWVRLVDLE